MVKKGPRLIEDFLVPHLNMETFGSRLTWINKRKKIFAIIYRHKNKADWTEEDAEVFVCWDRMKDPKRCANMSSNCYFTISRGRMNSALCKLAKTGYLKQVKSRKAPWTSKENGGKYLHYQIITGKTVRPKIASPALSESIIECESNTTGCNEISELEYMLSDDIIDGNKDVDDVAFLDIQDRIGKPDLRAEPTQWKDVISDDEPLHFDHDYISLYPEIEEKTFCPEVVSPAPSEFTIECGSNTTGCNEILKLEYILSDDIIDVNNDLDDVAFLDVQDRMGKPDLRSEPKHWKDTISDEESLHFDHDYSSLYPEIEGISSSSLETEDPFYGRWFEQEISNTIYESESLENMVPTSEFTRCTTYEKSFSDPEPHLDYPISQKHKKKVGSTRRDKVPQHSAKCTRCDVCDVTRSGSIPYSLRMKSRKQKQKLPKNKRGEELSHPSSNDTLQVKQTTLSADLVDVVFKCELCDICFCGLQRLKYHLKSKKHQRKVDVESWKTILGQSNPPSSVLQEYDIVIPEICLKFM